MIRLLTTEHVLRLCGIFILWLTISWYPATPHIGNHGCTASWTRTISHFSLPVSVKAAYERLVQRLSLN